jgi:hypothetical protein
MFCPVSGSHEADLKITCYFITAVNTVHNFLLADDICLCFYNPSCEDEVRVRSYYL